MRDSKSGVRELGLKQKRGKRVFVPVPIGMVVMSQLDIGDYGEEWSAPPNGRCRRGGEGGGI